MGRLVAVDFDPWHRHRHRTSFTGERIGSTPESTKQQQPGECPGMWSTASLWPPTVRVSPSRDVIDVRPRHPAAPHPTNAVSGMQPDRASTASRAARRLDVMVCRGQRDRPAHGVRRRQQTMAVVMGSVDDQTPRDRRRQMRMLSVTSHSPPSRAKMPVVVRARSPRPTTVASRARFVGPSLVDGIRPVAARVHDPALCEPSVVGCAASTSSGSVSSAKRCLPGFSGQDNQQKHVEKESDALAVDER